MPVIVSDTSPVRALRHLGWIDETKGRLRAIGLGLKTVGVLGVLLRAKKAGIIEAAGPLMDRLIAEINFRVNPKLYQDVLRLAGE